MRSCRTAALIISTALIGTVAQATTVQRVPLSTLAQTSNVIFHGVVRSVDDHLATSRNGPFRTAIELEVVERIKGVAPSMVTFRLVLPGGRAFDRVMRIPGMPVFAKGDEVVLLLERTSQGFALAGFSQGVFKVDRRGERPVARRDLSAVSFIKQPGVELTPLDTSAAVDLPSLLENLRNNAGGK